MLAHKNWNSILIPRNYRYFDECSLSKPADRYIYTVSIPLFQTILKSIESSHGISNTPAFSGCARTSIPRFQ